jgi:hypothetical protein
MIPKPSIMKLWAVNAALMPVFVAGLSIIGIPLTNRLIWMFLAVVLPLFTLIAAVAQSSFAGTRIDAEGIACPFPFAGSIPWSEVKRVRRQWPFVRVVCEAGRTAYLPQGWLVSNRDEYRRTLCELGQTSEAAMEIMTIVEPAAADTARKLADPERHRS